MKATRLWAAVVCAILLAVVRPASAEPRREEPKNVAPRPPLGISAVGACPSPDAIESTIESLIPQHVADVSLRNPQVAVADNGDSYKVRVEVDGRTQLRIYRDVGRDCAHRARVAAVFVVLTLMPPEVMTESPPATPVVQPPPAPVAPATPAVPRPAWRLSLGLAAVLDAAPAILNASASTSPGAEFRVGLQRGRLAGEIGLGVQPRSEFAVSGVNGRQWRLPFDVGVAVRQTIGGIELAGALGVAAAIFDARAVNTALPSGGTRLDVGARGGIEIRVGGSRRVSGFAGVHALYFPRPYELATTPTLVVGRTPSLWIGASAGAVVSF